MEPLDSNWIQTGELVIEGRLVDASNATLFGFIQHDISSKIEVVYKPIAGERPLWDFTEGTLANREVAAFELSNAMGFDCVPLTVMRDGPFGVGAVQVWVDMDEQVDVVSLGQSQSDGIRNIALFDAVINNTDRKFGHLLLNNEGDVLGCDHGVTFHHEDKLRTVIWHYAGQPLNSSELDRLKRTLSWLEGEESSYFKSLLSDIEISALKTRVDRLMAEGFPQPSTEWPAVPWPPV